MLRLQSRLYCATRRGSHECFGIQAFNFDTARQLMAPEEFEAYQSLVTGRSRPLTPQQQTEVSNALKQWATLNGEV